MLPFSRDQFIAVFAEYNVAVWPVQVIAYLLGVGAIVLLLLRSHTHDRIIGGVLAAMWLWTGIAYHWLYFSSINKAAFVFGALFVVQGLTFLLASVVRDPFRFGFPGGAIGWIGWALIVYAAVLYPLLGVWTGHTYPAMPMFGITPCPVTIFTFGLLLLTTAPVSRWHLVVPFVWSLIGGSAAFLLAIPQDWVLLISGVVTTTLLVVRDRGRRQLPVA